MCYDPADCFYLRAPPPPHLRRSHLGAEGVFYPHSTAKAGYSSGYQARGRSGRQSNAHHARRRCSGAVQLLRRSPHSRTLHARHAQHHCHLLAIILLGMLLIISRRKAIVQVVGFMCMENGLMFAAVAATQGMPMVVEMGVALDVLVAAILFGIFFSKFAPNLAPLM